MLKSVVSGARFFSYQRGWKNWSSAANKFANGEKQVRNVTWKKPTYHDADDSARFSSSARAKNFSPVLKMSTYARKPFANPCSSLYLKVGNLKIKSILNSLEPQFLTITVTQEETGQMTNQYRIDIPAFGTIFLEKCIIGSSESMPEYEGTSIEAICNNDSSLNLVFFKDHHETQVVSFTASQAKLFTAFLKWTMGAPSRACVKASEPIQTTQ